MCDDGHGHAGVCELLHNFQNLADHFGIEGGGGFVKQEHVRIHSQCADDGDTLFLSAGQAGRIGVCLVQKTDTRQKTLCLHVRLILCHKTGADRGKGNIPADGHVGKEIEMLEYHSHLSADHVDVRALIGQVCSLEDDLAACGHLQEIEAAQECRFSGTGRADDDDLLASSDILRDTVEHIVVAKGLSEILHMDHDFARLAAAGGLIVFVSVCHFLSSSSPVFRAAWSGS